jgi:competence ComEA-like helix-hairpin-helix protein
VKIADEHMLTPKEDPMKRFILCAVGAAAFLLIIATPISAEYYPGLEHELTGVVNINNAGVDDFLKLGLTMEQADNIMLFREQSGPFTSIEDLLKVQGITQTQLDRISSYLRTEGKSNLYYSD